MKLIVGLGNPGDEYIDTRHNIGFQVIDQIAKTNNIKINQNKFDSLIYVNEDFILMKPMTFMNLSGEAVKKVMDFYKISHKNILVVCDELDIKVGQAKIKLSTSSGGHNGIKSIIENLNTSEFYRLKIGIGRPKTKSESISKYVLNKFDEKQKNIIQRVIDQATDAIMSYIYNDINYVINNFNKKG